MNAHERESFIKSFLLFFFSIEILLFLIAYLYFTQQVKEHKNALYLEMKTINYTLEGTKFSFDFVATVLDKATYTLYEDENELYTLFPIPTLDGTWLKIAYDQTTFSQHIRQLKKEIFIVFMLLTLIVVVLSTLFSFYTLHPLRYSMKRMEEFLKDIIHDLNTPVTALILNAQLIEKRFSPQRAKRMELSAKTIGALHANLQSYLSNSKLHLEPVDVHAIVQERVLYFKDIYERLHFESHLEVCSIVSNKQALTRVIDNILSNACKYNQDNGTVIVTLTSESLTVRDYGIGIKDSKRIFERFYKETSRGLGIGLHIVKKLCDELGISIKVVSHDVGSSFVLILR